MVSSVHNARTSFPHDESMSNANAVQVALPALFLAVILTACSGSGGSDTNDAPDGSGTLDTGDTANQAPNAPDTPDTPDTPDAPGTQILLDHDFIPSASC